MLVLAPSSLLSRVGVKGPPVLGPFQVTEVVNGIPDDTPHVLPNEVTAEKTLGN